MAKMGCLPTNVMGEIHLGLLYTKNWLGKKLENFAILTK